MLQLFWSWIFQETCVEAASGSSGECVRTRYATASLGAASCYILMQCVHAFQSSGGVGGGAQPPPCVSPTHGFRLQKCLPHLARKMTTCEAYQQPRVGSASWARLLDFCLVELSLGASLNFDPGKLTHRASSYPVVKLSSRTSSNLIDARNQLSRGALGSLN